jgi:hypothetical protein
MVCFEHPKKKCLCFTSVVKQGWPQPVCVCVCARVCIYIIYIIHIALIKIGDAGCRQNGAGTAAVFSFTQNIIIKITTTTTTTTTNNNG